MVSIIIKISRIIGRRRNDAKNFFHLISPFVNKKATIFGQFFETVSNDNKKRKSFLFFNAVQPIPIAFNNNSLFYFLMFKFSISKIFRHQSFQFTNTHTHINTAQTKLSCDKYKTMFGKKFSTNWKSNRRTTKFSVVEIVMMGQWKFLGNLSEFTEYRTFCWRFCFYRECLSM